MLSFGPRHEALLVALILALWALTAVGVAVLCGLLLAGVV